MKDKIGFILLSVCFALFTPYLFRNLKNLLGKNVEPAPLPSNVVDRPTDVRMFTKAELAKYDGTGDESTLLYLCVMGRIYDVSRGAAHYGPGGSYNIFIGNICGDQQQSYYLIKYNKTQVAMHRKLS